MNSTARLARGSPRSMASPLISTPPRRMIATATFVFEDEDIDVTVSCGVAQLDPGWSSYDFVKAADEQLYEAKREGRNRVAPS